ncbi:MAG: hypothetical protein O2971_13545 [Proteobacteria bacterium]|nr:hypothetical protein [Pseudomonadota bacterium]
MLGKILLTLAVSVVVVLILRQRQLTEAAQTAAQPATKKEVPANAVPDESFAKDMRIGAYLFLVLMVGLGATLYYFQWQDDHAILTVNLHRNNQAEPVSYQVYKYQLEQRSFVTIDGTTVTVAGDERMEVIGLD